MNLLKIDISSKQYNSDEAGGKNEVLKNIRLDVHENDFVSILGPSGCGKSTLLRCIGGFEQYEGSITLDSKEINAPGKDRILVFQDFNQLFPWKTVLENIKYPLKIQGGHEKKDIQIMALSYLDKIKLTEYANYYPHQLSGGMKQRVAIARALVLKPSVMLMDEPFANLDAITRNNMQRELLSITENESMIFLFVTHNIQEAIILGNRIIVFSSNGEIIINEPNLLEKPISPSSKGYAELWEKYNLSLKQ